MMAATRVCRSACPPGHTTTWPPRPPLMGRVCTERSMLALVSGRDVSIIAGAAVGGAVCVGVVIGALLYMRRRTKPAPDHLPPDHRHPLPRLWPDKRPNTTEVPVADEERAEFLQELTSLRGEATNFLEMLSHTRNRFRTLGGPDSPTDTKAKAYRAVVRDLSRVLTLLNRKDEHILTVPGDWRRLLSWAARVLARYKRQKAAKESGDIPSLEPVVAGGTLYQTRRQAQAERCRLVTQGAPSSCRPAQDVLRITPQHQEGLLMAYRDTTLSQMGSRSTSLMSLTPTIFEEDEDENSDEILFKDDLETSPTEPFRVRNSNVKDCTKGSNFKIIYQVQHPHVNFHVTNEEILKGNEFIQENNNNITKEAKHTTQLSNMLNSSRQASPTATEKIMNMKNMGHSLETSNEAKHIKQNFINRQDYKNKKVVQDLFESKNETKTNHLKLQNSCVDSGMPESDLINATLSGEDVYINIIRKPVMVGLMLAGDPYRDDTIDSTENLKCQSQWANGHVSPMLSCKGEVSQHIPGPRCELTTEL
ncbi:uncharacterized protein T48 isoform X2 [Panulirus ornatus]